MTKYGRDYVTNEPSYYDYLAKLQKQIEKMVERIEQYDEILDQNLEKFKQEIDDLIEKTYTILDDIRSGGYLEEAYLDSLESWINQNLKEIVPDIAKFVWFGLNDEGYFIAVIPENWEDIQFDTTVDGHLVLQY